MRFSWTALILAPLLVPVMFTIAMLSFQEGNALLLPFLILIIPSCIISYGATVFLLLPALYVFSLWRPLTGVRVCLIGLVLGALVFVPMTWMDWKSSGIDSGPPTESFWDFALRWAADPFNLIFPLAGLVTSGV